MIHKYKRNFLCIIKIRCAVYAPDIVLYSKSIKLFKKFIKNNIFYIFFHFKCRQRNLITHSTRMLGILYKRPKLPLEEIYSFIVKYQEKVPQFTFHFFLLSILCIIFHKVYFWCHHLKNPLFEFYFPISGSYTLGWMNKINSTLWIILNTICIRVNV